MVGKNTGEGIPQTAERLMTPTAVDRGGSVYWEPTWSVGFVCLQVCVIAPSPAWLGLAVTIIGLSGLGALLARTIYGSPLLWGAGHFVAGIVFALVGMQLNLVG